ncbi:hypothetical protein [Sulfitobacter sp. SK011]|nr:hypothetical protein [Sulfitobacter sp. SK011]
MSDGQRTLRLYVHVFWGLQYYLGDMAAVQGGMSPDALGLYRPKIRWG